MSAKENEIKIQNCEITNSHTKRVFFKQSYSSNNKNFFLSLIGMTFILAMFTLWFPTIIIFFYYGKIVKLIIIFIYIIQISMTNKSKFYLDFLNYFRIHDYFKNYTLIIEEEIPRHNSIICGHPHGIMCMGSGLMMMADVLESLNVTTCVSRNLIFLPISGLLVNLLGFQGVDNSFFKRLLSNGKNVFFVPGGFECAAITNSNEDRVFIKSRLGFIKYALQNGSKLFPCYTFNENKTYHTLDLNMTIRLFLAKFKLPGCLFFGKFFLYPRDDVELLTVIGSGLQLPKIENPTEADIAKYHNLYLQCLVSLYDKYKLHTSSEKLKIY